jgi:hypothetical protein
VWFGRDEVWDDSATSETVIQHFIQNFHLDQDVLNLLFSREHRAFVGDSNPFQHTRVRWTEIVGEFGDPPDVSPEGGATLQFLEISGLGPTKHLHLVPSSRLNVVTGDNGLGKTFLLDVIWWALTHEWAKDIVVPFDLGAPASIRYSVGAARQRRPVIADFVAKDLRWKAPRAEAISGLAIYARVDGSFSVWDPANPALSIENQVRSICLDRDEVWFGDKNRKTEGLLRDWVKWQSRPSEFPAFDTFQKVVQRTRPPEFTQFDVGRPTRLPNWGSLEIPTIVHPYGEVPVVYESAGIKRVLALAYLIVWAWEEHKMHAKQRGIKEERQMLIILDEAEAHLHPKWQRALLPALIGISRDLHEELSIQYFIATHSPLVLASAEEIWDEESDKLFHLRMSARGMATFEELAFDVRGTANSWLLSPSFDNLYPGSRASEAALRQAKEILASNEPRREEIERISEDLAKHLPADDPFWLRWIVFATKYGVEL